LPFEPRVINAVAPTQHHAPLRQYLPGETDARRHTILPIALDAEVIVQLCDARGRLRPLIIRGNDKTRCATCSRRLRRGFGEVEIAVAAQLVRYSADALVAQAQIESQPRSEFQIVLRVKMRVPGAELTGRQAKQFRCPKDVAEESKGSVLCSV